MATFDNDDGGGMDADPIADVHSEPDGVDGTDGDLADVEGDAGTDGTTGMVEDVVDDDALPSPDIISSEEVSSTGGITGGVLVVQVENAQVQVGSVTVGFREGPTPTATPIAASGDCIVLSDAPPPTDGAPGLDAGTVSITGLKMPMELTPSEGADGFTYDSGLDEDNKTILGAVPTITVTATGGAHVPAFSGTAGIPAPVTVTQPNGDADKGSALTVAWNSTGAASTRIDLFVYDGEKGEQMKGNTVSCTLDGDPGTYTVPASMIGELPGGGSGAFNFDYLIVGVSRIEVTEVPLDGELGTVTIAVTRSGGGGVPFEK